MELASARSCATPVPHEQRISASLQRGAPRFHIRCCGQTQRRGVLAVKHLKWSPCGLSHSRCPLKEDPLGSRRDPSPRSLAAHHGKSSAIGYPNRR